jgi:hypothetical protein
MSNAGPLMIKTSCVPAGGKLGIYNGGTPDSHQPLSPKEATADALGLRGWPGRGAELGCREAG